MSKKIMFLISFILVLGLTANARADLEGYWAFNEGSSTTASDSSGNGRHGTISGATWHNGGWDGTGWCLDFDGENDLVELGAFDVVGSGITLASWFRPDDFDVYGSRLITKANNHNDDAHWWMLSLIYTSAQERLRFRLKTNESQFSTTLVAGSGAVVTDEWQHAAATWDGSMMRLYLDGVQVGGTAKGGSAVATDASVKAAIGSQPSDAYTTDSTNVEKYFDGLIDDVRVYNTALSQSQIQDLIDGSSPGVTPPNDDCVDAQSVGNVTNLPFDTTNATFDGSGHCMTSNNIWYRYTATCTGDVTVSLCGSSFDTMLAVYHGVSCNPMAASMVGCNDDACDRQSEITFAATAGSQYLIEVGGYDSEYGQGVLSISCTASPPPPVPNDDCQNAQLVGNVTNLPFDTTNATFDGSGHCMTSKNIWYRYTATCTGDVTVSLCGSSFDTMLAVYHGVSCNPMAASMVGCNDDACDRQSEITFAAIAGSQYLIEVGGYDSEYGQGVLSISCSASSPPSPPNDNCQNAQLVGNVTNLPFDTTYATFDGPGHCMASKNIWYRYTATCTGDVTVSLCGSSFDTMLAVYRGISCNPTTSSMVGCNDDACDRQSEITFAATAGSQYLIEVGGYSSEFGQGILSIMCEATVAGDSDLGDAPDSTNNYGRVMTAYPKGGPTGVRANYPTVYNNSGPGPYGPIHLNPLLVAHLGDYVTLENEADIGPDQDGTNNIVPTTNTPDKDGADDGVVFPISMPLCRWSTFDYIIKVINPGTNLWVNVWCDWNRDGDWNDDSNTNSALSCPNGFVSEWAVQNQFLFNLSAGSHQITTPAFLSWHPKTGTQQIWMRITISEQPWKGGIGTSMPVGGSGPLAGYEYGETEDYYFLPDTTTSICEDFNGDGVIDAEDLATFIDDWLDSCN